MQNLRKAGGALAAVAALSLIAPAALAGNLTVSPSANANALVDMLLGPGVTRVGNASLIAADTLQQGSFDTVGSDVIGFKSGILLTSGFASNVIGPNTSGSASGSWGTPGDADLTAISGKSTHDANVLEFDFTVDPKVTDVAFSYVFGSEEYNEYVFTPYNDVFAFFVDGKNVAVLPDNTPVTIDNINDGRIGATGPHHPEFFRNNSSGTSNDGLYPNQGINTQLDGITTVLLAKVQGALDPKLTTHHIKLAIADASDTIYDSAVFLKAGSFTQGGGGNDVPEPGTVALLSAMGLSGAGFLVRRRK